MDPSYDRPRDDVCASIRMAVMMNGKATRRRRESKAYYAVLDEVSSQSGAVSLWIRTCAWTWQNRNCTPSSKVVWYFVLKLVSMPQTPPHMYVTQKSS